MSLTRRIHRDQTGVALVFALLAVIILGGLAIVFVSRAYTQQRVTGIEQRYETTIHVAEAGVDNLIAELNHDFELTTVDPTTGDAHLYDPPTAPASSDPEDEKAWALGIAESNCTLVPTDVGEACAIRPVLSGNVPANFVFGVGFVPSRDTAQEIRVVKVGIVLGTFVPDKAILTDGDLNPFNITICGEYRDVHSNGSIVVEGGADTVTQSGDNKCPADEVGNSGDVTSAGTYTQNGSPDIGPGSGQTGMTQTVPPVSALATYQKFLDPNSEDFNTDYRDNWYNLCVNTSGQMEVRRPAYDAGGALITDPCSSSGELLYPTTTATSHFRGWRLVSETTGFSGIDFRCAPCFRAGGGSFPLEDGIYYARERNVYVSGNTPSGVQFSILVDSTGDVVESGVRYNAPSEAPSGDTCRLDGRHDGSIGMEGLGGGGGEPYLEDQLLLADRDVAMGGNFKSTVHGVIAAHEQVGMEGQPSIVGALVTEDACPTSANSPVSTNSVSGSFELDHSKTVVSTLPSVVNITAWTEY